MFSRYIYHRLFLSVLAILYCIEPLASAGIPPGPKVSIESVTVGVGQVTRPGTWTQLQVEFGANAGYVDEPIDCHVEVVAVDSAGNPATFPSAEITLHPAQQQLVSLYFLPGRLDGTVTINVVETGGNIIASKRLISAEAHTDTADFAIVRHSVPIWAVVGTIGNSEKGKSNQQTLQKAWADRGVYVAQLDSAEELPDQWRGLSSVSTVILSGKFDLPAEQSAALRQWVLNGGHAIVIAGTRIDELKSSPIADWVLQDREVTSTSLFDLSGLEAYAKSSFRIPIAGRIKGSTISVQDGIDVVKGIEGPLLTRSAHGFGRVTILGVDVDRPPLFRWRALDGFMAAVADLPVEEKVDEQIGQRISHSGITELATQFQVGLESIPGVEDRSTLTVLGLVLLFLLIIGPLDYFLVHRLLKKPGLTWLTFPSIVVAAGLIASAVAGGSNGTEIRSRMCAITDMDMGSGFARQSVWSSIYSPKHRRYQVQINHDPQVLSGDSPPASSEGEASASPMSSAGRLKWVASPESNYGGMYRSSGLSLGSAGYTFFEGATGIENLPIPAASDRILTSSATFTVSRDLFDLNLKQSSTGHLSRESTFTHHLPAAIDDWLLVYGNRVYFHDHRGGDLLGSSAIEPGTVWAATGKSTGGRELRSFLTGSTFQETSEKRQGGSEFEFSQVDWNRRETDLQTIIRMVTFYQLAGGHDYTGLDHEALSELELSNSIPLDRAILIGQLKESGASIQIDGQTLPPDQQDSFIRVQLPVEESLVKLTLPEFDD